MVGMQGLGRDENSPEETDAVRARVTLLSIADAVIVTDSTGRITMLNPVAEELTGWLGRDAKDLPIESVFRIVHESTREPVGQPVQGVIDLGIAQTLGGPTLLIARDGSERSVDDSAAPIRGEGGVLDGVVLVFRDVSERRREEQDLQAAILRGELIVATVRLPLVVLRADRLVHSANRAYFETYGGSPGSVIGLPFFESCGGLWDVEGLRQAVELPAADAQMSGEFELHQDSRPDLPASILVSARRLLDEGQTAQILLTIEDTTSRHNTARELESSEIRFRRLFETARDGILILDAGTGKILDANPFLLSLVGYASGDLKGQFLWDLGLLGDVEASRATFRELQEHGYVRYDDLPLATREGGAVEVEFISNVYQAGGSMVIQCNIRDNTERKRALEELRRAKEEAEQAGRVKDRFLAALSHELRTPLTPVLATVAYIESLPSLPKELRYELKTIRRNVELEARLIDDLLDVTRIGQGKLVLHPEVLDIHAAIRTALDVCQVEIDAKKLELTLALRAGEHHVWADLDRLGQVFWNLLKNAVKFTPAGGSLGIRSMDAGPGRIVVEVSDSGIGIGPEALEKVFDAFEQGDPAITREHGGLGLGLAIAKMLVDLHHGTLTATSPGQGRGSAFRLEMDTVSAHSGKERDPDPPAESVGPRSKILLVEDNADTLRAITMLLRSAGFEVRTAENFNQGLAALGAEQFDLMISDLGLPDGSGLDLMRHARDTVGLKGIAFSGYGTDHDKAESREAGFALHLTKPTSLKILVDAIHQLAS